MLWTIWTDFIALMFRRPDRFQAAALCHRRGSKGVEILLITSLTTGRWILTKGWPKPDHDGAGVALEEAWEEAGIRPCAKRPPEKIGIYHYDKKLDGGAPARTEVHVYAIEVEGLLDSYPEAGRRERRWIAPEAAAAMVEEPELKALLRRVAALIPA